MAADSNTEDVLESHADEALKILGLISALFKTIIDKNIFDSDKRISILSQIIAMVEKWFHFRNHNSYRNLRQNETFMLFELVELSADMAEQIMDILSPWSLIHYHDAIDSDYMIELKCNLSEITQGYIVEELIQRFQVKNGLGDLWGKGKCESIKYVLFRHDSPIWEPENVVKIGALSEAAKNSKKIHENFIEFIRMLYHFSKNGTNTLSTESVRLLASNKDILILSWSGAISQRIQPRLIGSFKEYKKGFEAYIGDGFELPEPNSLST